MEVGHAAENLLLQAVALGLGGVVVGAFYDTRVQETLGLPKDHKPLYLLPVGHPKE
jgi:nitroreductase